MPVTMETGQSGLCTSTCQRAHTPLQMPTLMPLSVTRRPGCLVLEWLRCIFTNNCTQSHTKWTCAHGFHNRWKRRNTRLCLWRVTHRCLRTVNTSDNMTHQLLNTINFFLKQQQSKFSMKHLGNQCPYLVPFNEVASVSQRVRDGGRLEFQGMDPRLSTCHGFTHMNTHTQTLRLRHSDEASLSHSSPNCSEVGQRGWAAAACPPMHSFNSSPSSSLSSFVLPSSPLLRLPPSARLPLSPLLVLHLTETDWNRCLCGRQDISVYVHALPPQIDSSTTCAQQQLPTDGGGIREKDRATGKDREIKKRVGVMERNGQEEEGRVDERWATGRQRKGWFSGGWIKASIMDKWGHLRIQAKSAIIPKAQPLICCCKSIFCQKV